MKIDPKRRMNTFELYGFDFMIDEEFRVYLIEVNTNPALSVPCPLLARVLHQLLDSTFK
jgi:D-alanine-D-alanine ligase-like ATP-grasp enzyme